MINEFAQRLAHELQQAIPKIEGLIPKRELHVALQSTLSRLDLVTREEFDAQAAVLKRTRERLEALEARCIALEQSNQS